MAGKKKKIIAKYLGPGERVTRASDSYQLASVGRRDQASTKVDPFWLLFVNEKDQRNGSREEKKD